MNQRDFTMYFKEYWLKKTRWFFITQLKHIIWIIFPRRGLICYYSSSYYYYDYDYYYYYYCYYYYYYYYYCCYYYYSYSYPPAPTPSPTPSPTPTPTPTSTTTTTTTTTFHYCHWYSALLDSTLLYFSLLFPSLLCRNVRSIATKFPLMINCA